MKNVCIDVKESSADLSLTSVYHMIFYLVSRFICLSYNTQDKMGWIACSWLPAMWYVD